MSDYWISDAIKHPGALRSKMGVKGKGKISGSKLNKKISSLHKKASKGTLSKPELQTLRQANLAKTLKKFHK